MDNGSNNKEIKESGAAVVVDQVAVAVSTILANGCCCIDDNQNSTKCTCLKDAVLMQSNGGHEEQKQLIMSIYYTINQMKMEDGSFNIKKFSAEHLADPSSSHQCTYEIRMSLRDLNYQVPLCHNRLAMFVQLCTGISRIKARHLIGSKCSESTLRNQRHKANLIRHLEAHAVYESKGTRMTRKGNVRQTIKWADPCLRGLEPSKRQKQKFYDKHRVKQLLSSKLTFLMEGHTRSENMMESIGGKVASIPDNMDALLSDLRRNGDIAISNSKWGKAETVLFREIDKDGLKAKAVLGFKAIFESVLHATIPIANIHPSYLKTKVHLPQQQHTDFDLELLERENYNQDKIKLAFTPLTKAGMFLQIWPRRNKPGHIIFVAYKKVLFLPCQALHGGGFLSCPSSHNLRLHFYIYLEGTPLIKKTNIYSQQYMDAKEVYDGLLDCFFEKTPKDGELGQG